MDAAVKELWVNALRSGEYKQGYGKLRSPDDKYCCLGVLCELAVKQGIIPEASRTASIGEYDNYYYDRESNYLPESVQHWSGLPYHPYANDGHLGNFNDSTRYDFNAIADLIEQYL